MTWNPLTVTLATWVITIPIGLWATRQMKQQTRSKLVAAYYITCAMSAMPFAIWAIALGGWWLLWLGVELVSAATSMANANAVLDGTVPKWAQR